MSLMAIILWALYPLSLPRSRETIGECFANAGASILILYLTPARAGMRVRAPP